MRPADPLRHGMSTLPGIPHAGDMHDTTNSTTDQPAIPQSGPHSGAQSGPPKPRHLPVEIAPETFVITDTVGEGVEPVTVHMNSMVIRGEQPIVVDTGVPANRERFLEDLFSLVDPQDLRWVFLSHDDVDHYGNVDAVMDACPNATLVTSWFMSQRLVDELHVAPTRWRWLTDGEALDVGDRVLTALRPPLYDSPTTRGLFDHSTGVYWASDCFAAAVPKGTSFVEELDRDVWSNGFTAFNVMNSPWVSLVDRDRWAVECRRLSDLPVAAIASTHGPTIEASDLSWAFELLRQMPDAVAPPQPDQAVLDGIVAAMAQAGIGA